MNFQILCLSKIKSLYYTLKLHHTIFMYHGACLQVDSTAKIIFGKEGQLHINRSHYKSNFKKPGILSIRENSTFEISDRVAINQGCKITIHPNAVASFGKCVINDDCKIGCKYNIKIGNNVLIGDNAFISDFDGHIIFRDSVEQIERGVIEIQDNVWIGANVTILKGVTIGKGSIIGAGSVVTKSIPENCIAVGNPCVVIKDNVKWVE